MKKLIFMFLLNSFTIMSFSQTTYIGFIDKYPIELLINDTNYDGQINAVYCYSNYDEPINLSGNLKTGKLNFFEKDSNEINTASLKFGDFSMNKENLEGIWTDLKTEKSLNIKLTKSTDSDFGILQPISLPNKYFRLIISGSSSVVGIKIFEKKTDKLLQKFDVECQFWGLNNINIGDFNFDGINDFSVFESSYAGPNTSSLYFLYNPKTKKYFESGFSGTSLEFDAIKKQINETNQCCAGSSIMQATYKVVKNKMVLIKTNCLKYDEKKQEHVKVKCD